MMIELVASEYDDPGFLTLLQRIVNGAFGILKPREIYLVHIDNWFDHKWLWWWSWKGKGLNVPPFTPNRVRSQKHFKWDTKSSNWAYDGPGESLHVLQPGRSNLARPLDQFSASGAFVWYSGNTANNKTGSLMFYLSGAEDYSWYASFRKNGHWKIAGEYRTAKRELASFEEHGRQMELEALSPESS